MVKNDILTQALRDAPTHGWSLEALRRAAIVCGHDALMADAVFSGGLRAATAYISTYFDDLLMAQIGTHAPDSMRVRERIGHAVMTRIDLMAPYKDGLRIAMRKCGARALWGSADKIWIWAGDTATDYNRYTKRALLSGVMASTIMFWFQDSSPGFRATHAFLERRIGNVLDFGRVMGMVKQFVGSKKAGRK